MERLNEFPVTARRCFNCGEQGHFKNYCLKLTLYRSICCINAPADDLFLLKADLFCEKIGAILDLGTGVNAISVQIVDKLYLPNIVKPSELYIRTIPSMP